MVIEARKLADSLEEKGDSTMEDRDKILQSLNALGYDEAAQYMYGMNYGDWKKAHAKKATNDQMQKYNESQPMWATHDKNVLTKRADEPAAPQSTITTGTTIMAPASKSLLSNVCCQDDVEEIKQEEPPKPNSNTRQVPAFQPPAPPSKGVAFSLGILTISDRASSGSYETGDLSGPAVSDAVNETVKSLGPSVSLSQTTQTAIVPDDMLAIQAKLKEWSDTAQLDLILTTGGTGFAPRDVTPEATLGVVEKPCPGLITFCTMECSKLQSLASLSRGTAGLRGKTLIVNLPGNPKGVGEIVPILLPLALHAVSDMQ
jgi:molybdenum cofactor synthesis domain-containing protein